MFIKLAALVMSVAAIAAANVHGLPTLLSFIPPEVTP